MDVDNVDTLAVMGANDQPGADEDDFHSFRRRRQEVEKETVYQEKKTRLPQVKHGTGSGIAKPFGTAVKPVKKVVFF
jgi:zinc finger CCHC domain-containing protein 9